MRKQTKSALLFVLTRKQTHLTFGREYTAAVEAKQVAQQEAERAKFVVEKASQDKLAIVIKAKGEAQAATMVICLPCSPC
jgi:regulator of protease activity HflC (stomatin/prohibitin superfamily)